MLNSLNLAYEKEDFCAIKKGLYQNIFRIELIFWQNNEGTYDIHGSRIINYR